MKENLKNSLSKEIHSSISQNIINSTKSIIQEIFLDRFLLSFEKSAQDMLYQISEQFEKGLNYHILFLLYISFFSLFFLIIFFKPSTNT